MKLMRDAAVFIAYIGAVALLVPLVGCAHVPRETLASSFETFIAEGRARGVRFAGNAVQLSFVDSLPGKAAGRCFPNRRPRLVEISREVWDDGFYTDDTRRQIVFHELGHCLLGIREHTINFAWDVYSIGIMEAELIPYERFHGREAEWLDVLFRWRR